MFFCALTVKWLIKEGPACPDMLHPSKGEGQTEERLLLPPNPKHMLREPSAVISRRNGDSGGGAESTVLPVKGEVNSNPGDFHALEENTSKARVQRIHPTPCRGTCEFSGPTTPWT